MPHHSFTAKYICWRYAGLYTAMVPLLLQLVVTVWREVRTAVALQRDATEIPGPLKALVSLRRCGVAVSQYPLGSNQHAVLCPPRFRS
jgi:hypothetical protein